MTDSNDNAGFDALVRVIESLQERIERDGDTIRLDETRTRMMLIDPMLNALGWDTTDPGMVIPEYRIGDKKVDYALTKVPKGRRRAQPIAFVEAKRMVEYLRDHRRQVFNYAYAAGVKYGCLTNGVRWVLYDVFNKDAPRNDLRVLDVSLRHESAFNCAVKLLLLQAANLEHGKILSIPGAQALLNRAVEARVSPAVVELLLDRGADTRASDSRGWTPLHHAVASVARCVALGCSALLHPMERVCGTCGMVQFMPCVECWRDTRLSNVSRGGLCPVCADGGEAHPLAVIPMLLDHGADIAAIDTDGFTPLHIAAERNRQPEAISLLLDRGADIEAKGKDDFTPLHWAAAHNPEPAVLEVLLDRGANITARANYWSTPLHSAAMRNTEPTVVKLLIQRGGEIAARNQFGLTPLHSAMIHKPELSVIRTLIDKGANVAATDIFGRTPYELAEQQGASEEVLRLLREQSL